MPNTPEAVLIDADGRPTLRFERVLPHPIERVWRALTETDELSAWHPTPYALHGRRLEFTDELPAVEVVELDPPRRLVHAWDEDLLRWQLREHDDGCLLVLIHSFQDPNKAARDAAGWHLCLDALQDSLAGRVSERDDVVGDGARHLPPRWSELNDAYQREFGISPADATPPPGP